jgi:uncharacterized protein
MDTIKLQTLKEIYPRIGSVAVAFSRRRFDYSARGSHDTLGDKAVAVTARSRSFRKSGELNAAQAFTSSAVSVICSTIGELSIPGFSIKPPDRCYLSKTELFTQIRAGSQGKRTKKM